MRAFLFTLAALSLFALFTAGGDTFGYEEDIFQEDTLQDYHHFVDPTKPCPHENEEFVDDFWVF